MLFSFLSININNITGRKRKIQASEIVEEDNGNDFDEIEEAYNRLMLQNIDYVFTRNQNGDDLSDSEDDSDDDDSFERNYQFFYDKYDERQSF